LRFGRPRPAEDDFDEDEPVRAAESDEPVDPSRLRGTEPLYGLVVAAELIGVAILNLTETTGKGAPKHPQTGLQVAGLIFAIAFVPLLLTRRRTLAAFGSIIGAFFVTLPRTPDKLTLYHLFGLSIAAGYGLVIATRRRREEKALGIGPTRPAPRPRSGGRRAQPGPRNPRPEASKGPQANRRYTPPKPKRKTPGRT
jgi:hypothetical protein